jgi:arylsulfate sulfotransferase
MNSRTVLVHTAALGLLGFAAHAAPLKVQLVPSLPSPQPVGTIVSLVPKLENPARATYVARYSVSVDGAPFHIVRDYSQEPVFFWSPELYEHEARVRVTVRNNDTQETVDAELPFRLVSRVQDSQPLVTATTHPLVALFSAPPCPQGDQFRVEFRRQGDSDSSRTSLQPCRAGRSNNVYVAGMRANSEYELRQEIVGSRGVESGTWITFHTGLLDGRFPPVSVPHPRAAGSASADKLLVRSVAMEPWYNMATDLEGNVVWTLPSHAFLTRVLSGGRFLVLADGANSQNDMKRWQLLREVDLLGNTVRETNISRVAEQLASRGIRSRCMKDGQQCVSGFHHEAIRLPNGHTLAIAGLERMFPDGAQGSKNPVDVLGDLVIDLDPDFQVAWVWNSFDHLDLNRASLGDEKCRQGPGDDGCTPVFLAATANGWLHSNSLNYIPGSGDLLISMPEQDWVLKIDYKDGKGSGKVLWRLGEGGDFQAKSNDPYPWFSYQHDAGFDPPGSNRLIVFDDGHQRKKKFPEANNRGQVWELDEQNRTATLVLNADLGVYAVAVGSAQSLANGGFSFESGFINPGPSAYSRETEVTADGKIAYAQQADGALTYRSFRVPDLYTAPRK